MEETKPPLCKDNENNKEYASVGRSPSEQPDGIKNSKDLNWTPLQYVS
jgi:hypothetical protein